MAEQQRATYTNPTAPTSISIVENIIKPPFGPTIYWEGAKDGTNNKIVGYRVYWRISNSGDEVPTTSSDYETYGPEGSQGEPIVYSGFKNYRGKYVRFGVQTIGEKTNSQLKISSKKIKINTLPEITPTVSGTILDDDKYLIGPIISFSYKEGYNAGTISLRVRYGAKGQEDSWQTKVLFEKENFEEKRYSDIRKEIGAGVWYNFEVQRTDDLGEKSEWTKTETYYTTAPPILSNYDNVINSNGIVYFKEKVGLYFKKDPGYNYIDVRAIRENENDNILVPTTRVLFSQKNDKWYGLWKGTLGQGEKYKFKITMGYGVTGYASSEITLDEKFYRIKALPPDINFTLGTKLINVYQPEGTSLSFSIRNFLGTTFFNGKEALEYGFNNFRNSFTGYVEINGTKGSSLTFSIDDEKSDINTLRFFMILSQNTALAPNIANKNRAYNDASFVLKLTNSYGDATTHTNKVEVNYCQAPTAEDVAVTLKVRDNPSVVKITDWAFPLKETMVIQIDGSISLYNTNPKIQFFANDTEITEPIPLKEVNGVVEDPQTSGAIKYIFTTQFELGEIKSTGQKDIRIKITTDAPEEYHPILTLYDAEQTPEFLAHTSQSAQVLLKEAKYKEEKLSFEITNKSLGADYDNAHKEYLKIQVKTQHRKPTEKEYTLSDDLGILYPDKDESLEVTIPFSIAFSVLALRLEVSTIQTVKTNYNEYTTVKSFLSNELFVYNVSPTVAYRKNYLGINTTDFPDCGDSVVVISEYEGKQKIYLISSSNPAYRTIDIVSGMIDGFIIDGGTW